MTYTMVKIDDRKLRIIGTIEHSPNRSLYPYWSQLVWRKPEHSITAGRSFNGREAAERWLESLYHVWIAGMEGEQNG